MLRGISISQLWKGLESPFLHSGLSLMALYQNPEFREDQRNFFFAPKVDRGTPVGFVGRNFEFLQSSQNSGY